MTVYKSKSSQPLKYLIALIVFIFAMGFTWSDVSGYENGHAGATDQSAAANSEGPSRDAVASVPTPVPEPGTLILLGSGLGVMYFLRKRRQNKS